ncbi:PTS system nitrogen regulatory IIA component [Parvularcula dongshanensis]|uniref:PTS system nitrogen regulatory IIA component n=2 Tax=Parvularcula dongshanensis TaxID=1173995 RepID=A0A840I5X0_9PROT|nr:PTS system nitrogen regulatory IIA component [Parvularcula dongshanensis]
MNDIRGLLAPEDVRIAVPARCRRDLLAALAAHAARSFDLDEATLLDKLSEREKLGSTGIGRGIALPHGKADVDRVCGVLFALQRPIDFDAVDDSPVDIAFLLVAPEGDDAGHLKALSRVARRLRVEEVAAGIRSARSAEAVHALFTQPDAAEAA